MKTPDTGTVIQYWAYHIVENIEFISYIDGAILSKSEFSPNMALFACCESAFCAW